MKIITYKPDMVKNEQGDDYKSPFKGEIKVEVPTYKERLTIIKSLEVGKGDDIDKGIKLVELVEKRVKSVELTKGKEKIDSLDELGYYKEGSDIINDIGKMIVSGFSLGN